MKTRRLRSHFSDEIYLVTGATEKKFGKFIKRNFPKYTGWVDGTAVGRMENPTKKGVLCHYIWISDQMGKKDRRLTVVHEVIHVCTSLFHECGIPLSLENDETLTYVHGDLCQQIFKRLRL